MFRPPGSPAARLGSPLMVTLVEPLRSAAPPRSQGIFFASAFSTCPEDSRVAIPFGSAGNTGSSASQPGGSSKRSMSSSSLDSSGCSFR